MTAPGHRTVADLASAAPAVVEVRGAPGTPVTGVAYDNRAVTPGDLFFCVVGRTSDGHRWAASAAAAGAAALVVERPAAVTIPQIVVADARAAMGPIGAAFYGHPADDLTVLGVTGTNGKTTTAYLADSILRAAGRRPALVGTIEARVAGRSLPGVRTTPEALDLQRLLFESRSAGEDSVVMEVTSHGLELRRVDGINFAAAVFTNLSQDHLDFHGSMESYFAAKKSLFTASRVRRGAINIDDPFGRRLLEGTDVACITFGEAPEAEVRPDRVRFEAHGSEFILLTARGEIKVSTPLVGPFNVSNCLAAASVCLAAGIEVDAIGTGLSDAPPIPGRFETIDEGQPFSVIVDYAHTPASLENVLRAGHAIATPRSGRVACVFGCGGDRDRAKRPSMGATATQLSDYVVVTTDNPRSEDPHDIAAAIVEGAESVRAGAPDAVIDDRADAIRHAVEWARAGDVIVIAGKGHESSQEFGDRVVPFSDASEARRALTAVGWGRPT